jgi:hypothetical protein
MAEGANVRITGKLRRSIEEQSSPSGSTDDSQIRKIACAVPESIVSAEFKLSLALPFENPVANDLGLPRDIHFTKQSSGRWMTLKSLCLNASNCEFCYKI